jgi:hypothetical protein
MRAKRILVLAVGFLFDLEILLKLGVTIARKVLPHSQAGSKAACTIC